MVQWVKYLPCKPEDLNSNPQIHVKPGEAVHFYNFNASTVILGTEIRKSPAAAKPASLAEAAVNTRKTLSPMRRKEKSMKPKVILFRLTRVYYSIVCLHTHHTYTQTCIHVPHTKKLTQPSHADKKDVFNLTLGVYDVF